MYNLNEDWTQANDLAASNPDKVNEMKSLFLVESAKNKNLPIGGGLWTPIFRPGDAPSTPYTEWTFSGPITKMPEFTAPKLGKFGHDLTMDLDVPAKPNGVLYALGGFSGGLSLYVKDGFLHYEYNLFEVSRTKLRSTLKLPAGKATITVECRPVEKRPASPMDVTVMVNGKVYIQGRVPMTAPLAFTANDCLDIGSDLGSPVSLDYFDKEGFPFNGKIGTTKIRYIR